MAQRDMYARIAEVLVQELGWEQDMSVDLGSADALEKITAAVRRRG